MRVLAISDTHGMHWRSETPPDADLLIHAGDFSMIGAKEEALDFLEWFTNLPHKHKAFICGNHDEALLRGNINGLPSNCHFLNYSSVVIEGIKICGIPFYVEPYGSKELPPRLKAICENDIDILVSHQPPYGMQDVSELYGHYGSHTLLNIVKKVKPKFHIFGHMHEDYGVKEEDGTTFINCALMGESYERWTKSPIQFEVGK
ncbi:metallophosphatase domain-containing protein [uncultured Porphyromonas sp.]|uniref:metallophosphoesterase family protein n=1 Tax=uncultured Porphyromonas sp. TaxID=159274 RepID=UPI00258F0A4A|nr:metallophosphatase domain-containing protein [uncultured Porphyromonas sp.]